MTRGTFVAFTGANPAFLTTGEFNGDMGPTMDYGEKFGPEFKTSVTDVDSFEKFAEKVVREFGYEDDYEGRDGHLYQDDGADVGGGPDGPFPLGDVWERVFNDSDYGYFKNFSDRDVWMKDTNGVVACVPPGGFECYYFGHLLDDEEDMDAVRSWGKKRARGDNGMEPLRYNDATGEFGKAGGKSEEAE